MALILSISFFELLWLNKWVLCRTAERLNLFYPQVNEESLQESLQDVLVENAAHYNIPESEEDTEAVKALDPLFNLADDYTSIWIYGLEDGMFRAGKHASVMDDNSFLFLMNIGYRLTGGEGEFFYEFPLQFANGTALVMVYDYRRTLFIYPYLFVCLFLSVTLFLGMVLFFLNHKIRQVLILKDEILTMSAGDLTHPVVTSVPASGNDEIGILAQELDHLRESLHENIQREQESRKANQDLITALSHDLRTPLTILTGYLEVLQLKRNPQAREEYLRRCLKKTEDIRELTDRMFEYALVAEETETPDIVWISTDFIGQCLTENCDFIRIAGFAPSLLLPDATGVLRSDKIMLKRIFNNLFSNILKYGNKKHTVTVSGKMQDRKFIVSVTNLIKDGDFQIDSNNIGLRNVKRMIQILGGNMEVYQKENEFAVVLRFPLM